MIKKKVAALPLRCPSCGSFMVHKVKTHSLICINCKSTKAIETSTYTKNKKPLFSLDKTTINPIQKEVDCPSCGADIEFNLFQISKNCPYCKTPLVTKTFNKIDIDAIIPFFIDTNEAKNIFKEWIGSLWFAPNALSDLKNFEHNFKALYLPYFSFDAKTQSFYEGERGDAYYVRVPRRVIINGREEIVEQLERRIRWHRVSGVVARDFADILVNSYKDLPPIAKRMINYDLNRLVTFNPSFLSSYESFEYNQEPREAYYEAKEYMKDIIYNDVLWDIGGDEQRVYSINTTYANEGVELFALPIWMSSFKYKNKEYPILINGLNGDIIGERPYSYVKIFFLGLFIFLIVSLLFFLENKYHFVEQLSY